MGTHTFQLEDKSIQHLQSNYTREHKLSMDLKSQSFNSSDHNLSLSLSPTVHLQQRIDLIYETQRKKKGNQPKSLNCRYSFNSVFIKNSFLLHHFFQKKNSISAYLHLFLLLNLQNLSSQKRPKRSSFSTTRIASKTSPGSVSFPPKPQSSPFDLTVHYLSVLSKVRHHHH